MKANRSARAARAWAGDEAGAFPVVEAILVAVLVLSAILFFTSVQRPTTGAEEGGLDLGQSARDTLLILQGRSFPDGSGTTLEGWVTNATRGDSATLGDLETFMSDVLPAGARYQLRLGNGVSYLTIAPAGGHEAPRGARGAEMTFLPNWATYRNARASWIMSPGEVATATSPWLGLVDASTIVYDCLRDPTGQSRLIDHDDDGATDWWIKPGTGTPDTSSDSHWKAAPSAVVTWKGQQNQVPLDALLGTWQAHDSTTCSDASPIHFQVVPPGSGARRVTDASITSGTTTLTSPSAGFTADDVGRLVGMTGVPSGSRISAVTSATQVTLTNTTTSTQTSQPATFGYESPYFPYTLQLVVWFGA